MRNEAVFVEFGFAREPFSGRLGADEYDHRACLQRSLLAAVGVPYGDTREVSVAIDRSDLVPEQDVDRGIACDPVAQISRHPGLERSGADD